MDESLVVLKRILCWDIDDVLYFTHKRRHADYKDLNITSEMADKIYRWNRADVALYKHFNETLWRIISEQDSSFYDEVKELKLKKRTLEKECIASSNVDTETGEIRFIVESNLSSFDKYLCEKMTMSEKDYIAYLKAKARLEFQEDNEYVTKQFQELEDKAFNTTTV
ncbi:hypothetical protein QZH41_010838 [Actinostola sp. cb2023]|nr:hypothetical protein QZH41_010838 [Actinostola sp. cb2023]